MIGHIDEPATGKIIDSNDLICKGWVYSENGIKAIAITLDGINIGNAKYGRRRVDVKNAFPDYDDIEKSGFDSYRHILLEDGVHSLLVDVLDGKGECKELGTLRFTVDKNLAAIERLNIELTNYCNLNCRWCAGSGSRRRGYMDFPLFKNIIDQVLSEKVSVREIHIYNVGESLLHPDFRDFLEHLGRIKERPNCVLVTNATVLSNELADSIISSGGLDVIQFSVILWNGDVTLCCADLHGRRIIGNIKNDDIFDLWKGQRLKMFRLQLEGRKKEIMLCRNCSIG